MTLKGKFRLMVTIAAVGLLVLAGMWMNSTRSNLLAERLQKTKSLVDLPYSIITEQYKLEAAGKLTRAAAQKNALDALRAVRYEHGNYFWVNDMHPTMIMHPIKPELDGQDLTNYKDPTGKAIFVEMVDAAKTPDGSFVYYMWPKPGSDKPVQKLSFVKAFGPWGWIIGTGIYIDDVDAAWHTTGAVAAGLGLTCLVLLLTASIRVSRSIFVRIGHMVTRMKDIADGDGDLTKRLEVSSDDEVAELAQWFNTFMDRLQEILCKVSTNSHSLAAAGDQIAATAKQQAHGAELQRDQTNQVATAVQEMAATVVQISENSSSAAAASQKASVAAHQGGKVVEETLSHMQAIAQSVGATARKVEELGKQSDQIGKIIGVIDDIADQTNLLALNAAIEAARAGEQGRGFAVVADEVRKLAERTTSATKEIAEMIRGIQAETRNAVTAMQSGTREVEQGVNLTTQAGSSLQEIIEMSEKVGEMITHIATASTQQSATTEEINHNIEQIAKIASSSALSAHQTTDAMQDLSGLASNLQRLVGQFHLGSEAGGNHGPGQRLHAGSQLDQTMAQTVDFARVKMAHRSWRLKLRGFLDGRTDLDPSQLGSHQTCELGKWIYGEGEAAYADVPDFRELENKHKVMHALVRQVVDAKMAGKKEEAEELFSQVGDTAEEVVALLGQVETLVAEPQMQAVASSM